MAGGTNIDDIDIDAALAENIAPEVPEPEQSLEDFAKDIIADDNIDVDSALQDGDIEQAQQFQGPVDIDAAFDEADVVEQQLLARQEKLPDPEIAALIEEDGPTIGDAFQTAAKAIPQFWASQHGGLSKFLYTLTVPEQFVVRNLIVGLEELNQMDTETAKNLMSRDEVHGSDVVDFFWGEPESALGRFGRGALGLLTDIVLDPLTWGFGIPGILTQSSRKFIQKGTEGSLKVGSKLINLNKATALEKQFFQTGTKVEKVLSAEGNLRAFGDDITGALEKHKGLIDEFVEQKITFEDLIKTADVIPSAQNELRALREAELLTRPSKIKEIIAGERFVRFGTRIPFTNTIVSVPFFNTGIKLGAKTVENIMAGANGTINAISRLPGMQSLAPTAHGIRAAVQGLFAKTGFSKFDRQQNLWYGRKELTDINVSRWEKQARETLKPNGVPASTKQIEDVMAEIELAPLNPHEARSLIKEFNIPEASVEKEFARLTTPTADDIARRGRIDEMPGAMEMIDQMREQNQQMVRAYMERGIPFTRLNPFGDGWAKSYIAHRLSQDWINLHNGIDEGAAAARQFYLGAKGVDVSASGRKVRISAGEVNEESLAQHGIKMFADDPVELHALRMREMDHIVRNHDLLKAASEAAIVGKNPGSGWIRFKPEEFQNLVLIPKKNPEHWKQFVPDFFKTAKEKAIYVPEQVHDRLIKNLSRKELSPLASQFYGSLAWWNALFRNNALYGTGYLGLNVFSNAMTYLLSGSSLRHLGRAQSLIWDNSGKVAAVAKKFGNNQHSSKIAYDFVDQAGKNYRLTGQELWDTMIEHNVIRSGIETELRFTDLIDNIATTRKQASKLKMNTGTALDVALGYRANRWMAQYGDEIPKIGVFMDRLDKGYSFAGAAEAAEKYFFNYNNISNRMSKVRRFFPFSTFPVKTVELAFDELKKGRLGSFNVPFFAREVMEGAYIPDEETREILMNELPGYKDVTFDPVLGPIIPGGAQVLGEFPYAKAALSFWMNPARNLHPFIEGTLGFLGTTSMSDLPDEEIDQLKWNDARDQVADFMDTFLPPPMKNGLAIAELSGRLNITNGFFSQQFTERLPAPKAKEDSSRRRRFDNAKDLGLFFQEHLGEDFFFNQIFPQFGKADPAKGTEEGDITLKEQQLLGGRGNFVRRHFRQLALGLATMTRLDKNIMLHKYSIDMQMKKAKQAIVQREVDFQHLYDPSQLEDAGAVKDRAQLDDLYKNVDFLDERQKALAEWYDWFLHGQEEIPDFKNMIFGLDEYEFDFSTKPRSYDILKRDATKEIIFDLNEGFDADAISTDPLDDIIGPEEEE